MGLVALVCSLLRRRKSVGMDGGRLEGQRGGMFAVFLRGISSVGRFTGRQRFQVADGPWNGVSIILVRERKDVVVDFQQVDYGFMQIVFARWILSVGVTEH